MQRFLGDEMSAALRALEAEVRADLDELGLDALNDLRELGAGGSVLTASAQGQRVTGTSGEQDRDLLDDEAEIEAEARSLLGNAFVDRLEEVDAGTAANLQAALTDEARTQLLEEIRLLRERRERRNKPR